MMKEAGWDASLCDCCLLKLANNDTSGCDFHGCHQDREPLWNLTYFLADGEDLVPGGDEDEFSTATCDGCLDESAGRRTLCPVLVEVSV